MLGLLEEIREEFYDFIEDFGDILKRRQPRKDVKMKEVVVRGQLSYMRPAYLFAERVENGIKIIFGISLLVSAVTSTFIGFSSLSQLVEVLIENLAGRAIMLIIGFSYVVVALWKTLHLSKSSH